jgi:hypothetical protein
MNDDHDAAFATVKRELAWAGGLALAGGVVLLVLAYGGWNDERQPTAIGWLAVVLLAVLTAIAAYREPRLGCLFPLASGGGAMLAYRAFVDDPYWPIGLQILALETLPYFAIAVAAQTISRARRRGEPGSVGRYATWVAFALGVASWLALAAIARDREAWDSPLYFSVLLPASVVIGFVGARAFGGPAWRWPLAFFGGELATLLAIGFARDSLSLWPLSIGFLLAFSLPCWLAAAIGTRLRAARR